MKSVLLVSERHFPPVFLQFEVFEFEVFVTLPNDLAVCNQLLSITPVSFLIKKNPISFVTPKSNFRNARFIDLTCSQGLWTGRNKGEDRISRRKEEGGQEVHEQIKGKPYALCLGAWA